MTGQAEGRRGSPGGRRRGWLGAIALLVALAPAPLGAAPEGPKSAGPVLGPAMFDRDKPIEITSDTLDVDQEAQIAIFEGQVDAIQGEVHLTADRLIVHYDGSTEAAATGTGTAPVAVTPVNAPASPPAAAPPEPSAPGGKIRRMDVEGNVFVSSPTETASGDNAVYNVDTGKIVLTGNVVLTRGKNVIHGTKLSIDVDSGRSIIEGQTSAYGKKGRVKSLFVPKKDTNGTGEPSAAGMPPQ